MNIFVSRLELSESMMGVNCLNVYGVLFSIDILMFLNVAIHDIEKRSQKKSEALFLTTSTPMRTLRGVSKTLWGSMLYNSRGEQTPKITQLEF